MLMPKVIIMLIIANRKVDRREIDPRVTDPKKMRAYMLRDRDYEKDEIFINKMCCYERGDRWAALNLNCREG